ncbi:HNH endonuclease signature motif containing protein [Sciscionella marina]|uniref:HNH endonuclease signature motif containing protein n=1 Tax=Sciscionella marina TaxID=508770 RepID=UPI000372A203|nr:HNH endonuclease signature motif containing protein [Sciscionella marina]
MNAGVVVQDSAEKLLRRLGDQFMAIRRAEAGMLDLVAQLDKRGAPVEFGYRGSPARMVEDVGRVGLAEARRIAERARALFGALGISGEPLSPDLPNTAEAYSRGDLGAEHVDRIRRFATELPADVLTGGSWPIAENCLAQIASETGPRGLSRPIRELHARLDPDGQAPNDHEPSRPWREIWVQQRADDWLIEGHLDQETGLKLRSVLDALNKNRSPETVDGATVFRRPSERDADAFAEIVQLAANPESLPENGGEPFTIVVTMSEECLREGVGAGTTMDGSTIPATQLRRIACDAGVIPTVLGSEGEVLDMGCRERTAPPKLRRRLIARDRGCAHPDCDKPPALTQAHHVRHHANGGYTTEDNMVLLCAYHHTLVHHTAWEVRIHNGRPEFSPPGYRAAISAGRQTRRTSGSPSALRDPSVRCTARKPCRS